jgi:outer membrane protein insertion porin family
MNVYADKIEKISVNGNVRISDKTVILFSKAKINQEVNEDDFNNFIKDLYETDFFKKVQIKFEDNILTFSVVENPIIQSIKINGIKSSKYTEPMYEIMSMKEKNSFVEDYISKDLNKIKSFLKVSGFYFSVVEVSLEKKENNTVDLIYDVNLGDKASIRGIKFIGNKIYKDKRLKNIIVSEEDKFWKFLSKKKYLNERTVNLDTRLLKSYYLNKGYYKATIESSSASLVNDGFELIFNINAGEKFYFNKFKLIIPSNYEESNFKSIYDEFIKLKNQSYSTNKIQKILDKVDSLALSRQYEFINASIKEEIVDNNKLNLIFTIGESKKYYVDRVNIIGNDITEETVIRNLLVVDEGDPFNELLNAKSINQIKASNLFKKVEFEIVEKENNYQKDINIIVEEQPTGEISAGAGVGSSGSTVSFGIKEANFNGKGIALNTNLTISPKSVSGGLNFSIPNYNYSDKSLEGNISRTDTDNLRNNGYKNKLSNISLGTSFEQRQNFYFSPSLSFQYETIETDITASAEIKKQSGNYYDLNLDYGLYYDKRNQRFKPSSGFSSNFVQRIPLISNNYTFKNSYSFNQYKEISDEMIGSLRFYLQSINSLSNNKNVRVSERLQVPANRLRGFKSGNVGPIEGQTFLGGNYLTALNLGTSLPTFLPELQSLDFSIFLDAANVWGVDYNDELNNKSSTVRSSAGLAIDLITPIGPLNFIFAKPITKASSDKTEFFRFDLGTTF